MVRVVAAIILNLFAVLGIWAAIGVTCEHYAIVKLTGPVLAVNALIASVCVVVLVYMAN